MVVVKILPAKSNKFEGVAYNEKKVSEEKSNLLSQQNFIGLDENSKKEEFVDYLQHQSALNPKVKKPQFHVTVSAKGKDKSFEELKEFGEHYMKEMGYGDNPYLIYKHDDTANNHIHIVSTRVDSDGKKINDSMERVRTQKIINRYYGLDIQKQMEAVLKKVDKYNVTTIAQYKLLLEREFKKVIEKDDNIAVFRSEKKFNIEKEYINKLIVNNLPKTKTFPYKKRAKELRELFLELSQKHTLEELQLVAGKKNIDIAVFKTADGSRNFGYSVIDKKTKTVFKGSQILPLKVLETNKDITRQIENLKELIGELSTPKMTLEELNEELARTGKKVDEKGNVFDLNKEGTDPIFSVKRSTVYQFQYNSILKDINENYRPVSQKDAKILSFLFRVKADDIKLAVDAKDDRMIREREEIANMYNYVIENMMKRPYDTADQLKENGIEIFKLNNDFFIIDKDKSFIGNIDFKDDIKATLEKDQLYTKLDYNSGYEKLPMQHQNIGQMLDSLSYMFQYSDEKEAKKNKKKRRNQNGNISY